MEPSIFQQAIVDESTLGKSLVLQAYAGSGKALALYEKVLTPLGMVNIADITIGDAVVSALTGNAVHVTGVFPQGITRCLEITFTDGVKVHCSPDHLWEVFIKEGKPARELPHVRTAESLMNDFHISKKSGFKYAVRNYSPNHVGQHNPWAYFEGFMLGNGDFGQSTLQITASLRDFQEFINTTQHLIAPLRSSSPVESNFVQINYSWKALPERLQEYRKTQELSQDSTWFSWDLDSQINLLAGLYDSDGSNPKTKDGTFCSTSVALLTLFTNLVQHTGGCAWDNRTQYKSGVCGNIAFRHPQMFSRLTAKKWYASKITYDMRSKICNIEEIEPRETLCIKIDSEDGLFVTTGYKVTHNTATLKLISEANPGKKKLFLAFNRSVAYELGSKISAVCKTVHSLGMSVLAPYGFNLRESKSSFIAKELGISRKRTLEFEEFWNAYRLTDSFPDSEVQEAIVQDFCESDISEFYSYAAKCEELALKMFLEHGYGDFCDMIYLSTKLIRNRRFDFNLVMVDEHQDSSPIALKLVQLLGDNSVQRIFVGDQYQNIYNTLNCTHANNAHEAKKLWGCKEMSLPITYRCPDAIVEEAQKYVPDIISFRQGGQVTREAFLPDEIPKGALILGAKYEFIMPEFIERRLAGEKCVLRGHNFIEESLKEAKKCLKSSTGFSFPTLMLMASEVIEEKAARVPFTLAGQARKQRFANMKNVLELLSERFDSFDEASKFAGAITKETKPDYEFSSIHRAKGSESEDVYFLEASQYEDAALSGDMDCLRMAYVAVTRSQERLCLVG